MSLSTDSEKKYLVVSFFVTNEVALSKLKEQWSKRTSDHGRVLGRSMNQITKTNPQEMGGSIVVVDPSHFEKGFLAEIDVPLAFGMCFDEKSSSLIVAGGNVLNRIKNGKIYERHSHNLYNDIHGLSRSSAGTICVASTGTDALLEVAITNLDKVYWDWLATENGYPVTGAGQIRTINREINYGEVLTSTPEHTTHINGSLVYSDRVLATLFHQGELIEIDKNTKKSKILLSGLKSPHNIRLRNGGYSLCDTRANRVLLLDGNFKIQHIISSPEYDWVQDAIEIPSLNGYVIADSNNGRLLLVNQYGEEISRMQYSIASRKVASMELLSADQIKNIFNY